MIVVKISKTKWNVVSPIYNYFKNNNEVNITAIFCNKAGAGVFERGERLGVKSVLFSKDDFVNSNQVINQLKELKTDFVVLAGFLWLVPANLVAAFPNKIINIHPALLPKYGGKGMYGMNVHDAVVANKETETGITIHLVNEEYDKGAILLQARCPVSETDSAEDVAHKIHKLEYQYFPVVVDFVIKNL